MILVDLIKRKLSIVLFRSIMQNVIKYYQMQRSSSFDDQMLWCANFMTMKINFIFPHFLGTTNQLNAVRMNEFLNISVT